MSAPAVATAQPEGGPRSSFERVRAAVEQQGLAVRNARRDSFMASCPVHEDSTPSLKVAWESGPRGGLTLLHCHGCQADSSDIVEALGLTMSDLFDEPLPERERTWKRSGRSPQSRREGKKRGRLGRLPPLVARAPSSSSEPAHQWREVAVYAYVDADGAPVQEVVRRECVDEDGTHQPHKVFVQRYWTPEKWVDSAPTGFRRVLYRAPQVRAAVAEGRPVWLLEGEKDVETAEALGVTATTNTQGGGAFPAELVEELRDADVVMVLDRDATGYKRGVDLHERLSAVGARVLLRLPVPEGEGSDLTDHVRAGHRLDDLVAVHVQEVQVQAAHGVVRRTARRLQQAAEQAAARQQLADDGRDVEENLRCAHRWVMETQIRQEALRAEVGTVHGYGLRVGTEWAGEAIVDADRLLIAGTRQARRAHEVAGIEVPAFLREQEPEGAGAGAPGSVPAPVPAPGPAGGGETAGATAAVEVEESAEHAPSRGLSGVTGGGGASAPVFRALNGQIVQWEPPRSRRRGSSEEGEDEGSFKVILSTVVKITAREYLEVADAEEDADHVQLQGRAAPARPRPRTPRQLTAVRLAYFDPVTDEPVEMRVVADHWRDHSWLESLPGPVDYDHKRAGLDTLQRAIIAVSSTVVDEVLPRSTGWRQHTDGTYRFIHHRGAITAEGHVSLDVEFFSTLKHYDLPDPTRDAARLREAFWQHSGVMLTKIPARAAAPLLGHVYRSALGRNPWLVAAIGPPGSFKTSVVAKAMQHWGERWQSEVSGSSMSGHGDTLNVVRYKLHHAKDTLFWMDDFAPTDSWVAAQTSLEATARLVHNGEARSRSARDGLSITPGTPPRASGIFTSEVMPRPGSSGGERMLVVPLAPGDIDKDDLFPLDNHDSRYKRALVMSSFISWLAEDLTVRRAHYLAVASDYADQLTGAGESIRQGQALAHTWAGWVAMSDFLLERGAITEDERTQLLVDIDRALREAGLAAVNPDMPRSTGARVLELLRFALQQGLAHVNDVRTGDCPPLLLARRLGWQPQNIERNALGDVIRAKLEPKGDNFGFVLHDPDHRDRGRVLMCSSTQLEAVLKTASNKQAEKLELDRNTALRALAEIGALVEDTSEGRTRYTVKCRIHAENRTARMVVLHLDRILGSDDGSDDAGGGGSSGDAGDDTGPGGPADDDAPRDAPGDGSAPCGGEAAVPAPTGAVAGEGPVGTLPGLLEQGADPQVLDAVEEPRDGVQTAPDQGDDVPDQPPASEELSVRPPAFTPRAWTDAAGVVGWSEPKTSPEPDCVLCGRPCGVQVAGTVIHLPCWERSTAASRSGSGGQRAASTTHPAPARPTEHRPAERRPAPRAGVWQRPATTSVPSGKAAAAVVDLDGVWCSDGCRLDLPWPVEHVGDLARLAHELRLGSQVTKYLASSAQVWLGDALAAQMGIDVEAIRSASMSKREQVSHTVTAECPAVTGAVGADYQLGGRESGLGRWTRVWKGTDKSVWVVLLAAMERGPGSIPLLGGDPDHATLARRIGLLAGQLGAPFALTGSATGLDLMTALRWKDRERFFAVREPLGPARVPTIEADLNWSRRPTAEESQHEWVHAYDRSGSYLAGATGLDLGVGEPVHHPDGRDFVKLPGYWRIEVPESGDRRVPNPLDPGGEYAGRTRWVTTPTLELALEQEYDPTIVEAWTWPDKARILDPWYDRIRDARTNLDRPDADAQAARDQLKAIYAETIGMLGSATFMKDRPGYAPERRHHIIAKARANILRRVASIGRETGRWPVAILADTVIYTSAEADPVAAWPGGERWLGRELGRYKVEGSAPLTEQLQYLTGGGYRGKDALTGGG